MSHCNKDCYFHGYGCLIMQFDGEFSCKLCYWKSFVENGLTKSVNDCRFVTTNFIATIMKIQLQLMNVKERRYCLSFDDFEC